MGTETISKDDSVTEDKIYISGLEFEEDVLGISNVNATSRVEYYYSGYTEFDEAVEITKSIQGRFNNWNPKEPKTKIGMQIFNQVKSYLGDKWGELRLYVSLGTPLDWHFGTDCFFQLKDKGSHSSIVTIDLTINSYKRKEDSNANYILKNTDLKNGGFIRICMNIAERLKIGLINSRCNKKQYFKRNHKGGKKRKRY